MKNKKMKLEGLKVQSFITSIGDEGKQTIKGQDPGGITALCAESQVCPTQKMNGSDCQPIPPPIAPWPAGQVYVCTDFNHPQVGPCFIINWE